MDNDTNNPTYYKTIVNSQEWKDWTKHAEDNLLFDMPESIETGWLSPAHWSAFIEWVKNKAGNVVVQKCNCEMEIIENLSDNICPECEREIEVKEGKRLIVNDPVIKK